MNISSGPTGPRINDQYWFAFSESFVNKAIERREQAAEKIQNLVVWLWGIYTASAAIGFALSKKQIPLSHALLIAGASVALIVVYCATVWVRMPSVAHFDPRSPDEIKKVYIDTLSLVSRRLNLTLLTTIVAATMVCCAILVTSISGESDGIAMPLSTVQVDVGSQTLAVTGFAIKARQVTVRVRDAKSGEELKGGSRTFVPTDSGLLQVNMPIDQSTSEFDVAIEWEDSTGLKTQVSRRVQTAPIASR